MRLVLVPFKIVQHSNRQDHNGSNSQSAVEWHTYFLQTTRLPNKCVRAINTAFWKTIIPPHEAHSPAGAID